MFITLAQRLLAAQARKTAVVIVTISASCTMSNLPNNFSCSSRAVAGQGALWPRFGTTGQPAAGPSRSPVKVNGSAQQKESQWLAYATDAERSGDMVEAELCRQYAEHWFRVSRGRE